MSVGSSEEMTTDKLEKIIFHNINYKHISLKKRGSNWGELWCLMPWLSCLSVGYTEKTTDLPQV
jgi:hypothetical protein